ncbi:MAG: HesA/MoeB/ThiF family protein [Burkholderiaceae bacterium]|nr:HesA/MoeB/ThiF family protein [Burkholderiaceae bacterium]
MNDAQLLRYSRHLLLDEIGVEGQEKWLAARVLIVGLGGLGSSAAFFLASAGVGHLTLADHDTVDLTNLQRQIAHTTARIGQPKVASAREALLALNPDIAITTLARRLSDADLLEQVAQVDLVLDCTDNFATRQAINAACVARARPLVSGAAMGFDGQLTVIDPRQSGFACYACLYPPVQTIPETRCATMGVFAPLVGIVGSMQAAETLKLLAGLDSALTGQLLLLNWRNAQTKSIRYRKAAHCPVCGAARA